MIAPRGDFVRRVQRFYYFLLIYVPSCGQIGKDSAGQLIWEIPHMSDPLCVGSPLWAIPYTGDPLFGGSPIWGIPFWGYPVHVGSPIQRGSITGELLVKIPL